MKLSTVAVALIAALILTGTALADPGPAPPGSSLAEYNPATGEIIVSINGVNNWYVQSASFGLTGASPIPPLPVGGGLVSDNDQIIGETGFVLVTFTDLDLGNVAATGLPLGDLTINWNAGLDST